MCLLLVGESLKLIELIPEIKVATLDTGGNGKGEFGHNCFVDAQTLVMHQLTAVTSAM